MLNRACVGTLVLVLLGAPEVATAQPSAAKLTDAQAEQFLQTARVVSSRRTEKGVTGSVRATLSDGTLTHDAHIQTIDEFKGEFKGGNRTEINFRDNWQFNVAAYRIDRLLGLNLVPVSVDRTWKGQGAAFTWWIDDVMMDEEGRLKKKLQPPDALCWSEQLWALRVFDQLIDNSDRNLGNSIISNSWRLWGIDHTRAFRYSKEPRNPALLIRIDRALLQRLKALAFPTLKREVGKYLSDTDIRAILSRRDGIVTHFEKLGESSLYDRRDPAAGCPGPASRGQILFLARVSSRVGLYCHFSMVTTCAWILPSTAPRPNRRAIASAAMSVASPSSEAFRASISFRNGVPWQYPIAGMRGDSARLRAVTVVI